MYQIWFWKLAIILNNFKACYKFLFHTHFWNCVFFLNLYVFMHRHVNEHDQHIYSNKKFFEAYLSKFSKLFGDGICCGWYLISNAHITVFTILWQSRTKNLETARRVQGTTAIWNSLLGVYPTGNFLSFPLVLFHGRESGKSRIPSQWSLCVRKDSPARKDID